MHLIIYYSTRFFSSKHDLSQVVKERDQERTKNESMQARLQSWQKEAKDVYANFDHFKVT